MYLRIKKIFEDSDFDCQYSKIIAQTLYTISYDYQKYDFHSLLAGVRMRINDPEKAKYYKNFSIMFILKACLNLKEDPRNQRNVCDIAYKTAALLIVDPKSFTNNNFVSMFKIICTLQLHLHTSHKKVPSVLYALHNHLASEFQNLTIIEKTKILQAYYFAPVTLDQKLMHLIINEFRVKLNKLTFSLGQFSVS